MELSEMLGYAAGFLTTVAFIPQVLKIWRSKSAEDVSFATFAAFTLGVVLWLLYGIARQEPPIIIWNSVTLVRRHPRHEGEVQINGVRLH